MEVSDIEEYIKKSTAASGVPLKVSDTSTLMSIASQLSRSMSKSIQDDSTPTLRRSSRQSRISPSNRALPREAV